MTQNAEYIKMVGDALLKQTENERKPFDPQSRRKTYGSDKNGKNVGN